jgi:two-component sensor histidine kinase
MTDTNIWPRRWAKGGLLVGVWTALGLFEAGQTYFYYDYQGNPLPWWQAFAFGMALWYAWAIVAVVVVLLARRFPVEQRNWPRWLLIHVPASVLCALLKLALDYPVIELFYCPQPGLLSFGEFFRMAFPGHFHPYVLIYWAILGVWHALDYSRKYRDRELLASQLQARLAQAQLQVLRMQLHPHFLFNTLNAISALVHKDVHLADRMIARLGDLLRLTLENIGRHEVSLKEELDFIQMYLEIEQARFGPRLQVELAIDPEALDARVPYLVLQPLVENAIRHGIAPRTDAGRVALRAERVGPVLRLQVYDDGPGLPAHPPPDRRRGIGLANTRARLQQLYGSGHQFEIRNGSGRGLTIAVTIPFQPTPGTERRTQPLEQVSAG